MMTTPESSYETRVIIIVVYFYENIKTDCFPNKFHFVFSLNTHPKNVFTSTSQLLRNVAATKEKKRDANRPSPPSYDPDLAV